MQPFHQLSFVPDFSHTFVCNPKLKVATTPLFPGWLCLCICFTLPALEMSVRSQLWQCYNKLITRVARLCTSCDVHTSRGFPSSSIPPSVPSSLLIASSLLGVEYFKSVGLQLIFYILHHPLCLRSDVRRRLDC